MDSPTFLGILAVSVATVCWCLKYILGTLLPNTAATHSKVFGSLQESFSEEQRRTREAFTREQHDTRVAFALEQADTRKAFAKEQEDTRIAFKQYLNGLACFNFPPQTSRFHPLPPVSDNGITHETPDQSPTTPPATE